MEVETDSFPDMCAVLIRLPDLTSVGRVSGLGMITSVALATKERDRLLLVAAKLLDWRLQESPLCKQSQIPCSRQIKSSAHSVESTMSFSCSFLSFFFVCVPPAKDVRWRPSSDYFVLFPTQPRWFLHKVYKRESMLETLTDFELRI